MSNDGTTSSVTAVTTPRPPRETGAPAEVSSTTEPSPRMTSTDRTAPASDRAPEPWVAVAIAPAMVMCGSDGSVCRARPAAWSFGASWARVAPAFTRTVPPPASKTSGIAASESSVPVVSAIGLNECPEPTTCTALEPRTIARRSSAVVGVTAWAAVNVMLPAQLVLIRIR